MTDPEVVARWIAAREVLEAAARRAREAMIATMTGKK